MKMIKTYLILALVGLKPTTPQKCAGSLIPPAESVPNPRKDDPEATMTADPPDAPPGVLVLSRGFKVLPKTGFAQS